MTSLFKINSPRTSLFLLAVFWLLSLGLISFFDWKLLSLVERKTASLIGAKINIAGFEERKSNLFREGEYLAGIGNDTKRVDSVFIDKESPIVFIEKLEKFAKSLNVKLVLSVPEKRDGTVVIKIEAGGQFTDVLDFLKGVEAFREQGIMENLVFELVSGAASGDVAKKKPATQVRARAQFEFLAK